jgi:hypothetical protein
MHVAGVSRQRLDLRLIHACFVARQRQQAVDASLHAVDRGQRVAQHRGVLRVTAGQLHRHARFSQRCA